MWLVNCVKNADHDNPLDPEVNIKCVYRGKVYTYYNPYKAIRNANVFITPGHYWAETNSEGEFLINNLEKGDYTVHISASGYAADTVQVSLDSINSKIHTFHLNGLPLFTNYHINSGYISRWWPQNPLYVLKVEAEINDPDGFADVEHVSLNIPYFNIKDTLNRTDNPARFYNIYNKSDFSINNFHQFLGHSFYFEIMDKPGAIHKSQDIYIARIIEITAIPISPKGAVSVTSTPTLVWQSNQMLGYPFSYKIEIILYDPGEKLETIVRSISGINQDSTSIEITESLSSGTYYWTVSIVDEFGNWSRSKEASFIIE